MFDFAWSQIALIGVVALVLIGPKDLPVAIKAVTGALKKARRMASEFQTHVDELVREADLQEVRDGFNAIRRMDVRGTFQRAVDADGSIRRAFSEDPFKTTPVATPPAFEGAAPASAAAVTQAVDVRPAHEETRPADAAPPFVPPQTVADAVPVLPAAPPAFIPPDQHSPDQHNPDQHAPRG